MNAYRIDSRMLNDEHPEWQALLGQAHRAKTRPSCLCTDPPPPMYIAHVGDHFAVKRMPNTGGAHAPTCDSYEMPPELSGLSDVLGSAIREDVDAGTTAIKLGFSLTRLPGRKPPTGSPAENASVKADTRKLTLRGLLHYLWESARLNYWTPGMEGKRNWFVIRKYLLLTVAEISAKGHPLKDVLYIPEAFKLEHKTDIEHRRKMQLAGLTHTSGHARSLMIVIGLIKEFTRSTSGHLVVLKHLPDFRFAIAEDLLQRLNKRFENELAMMPHAEHSQILLIGTFGVSPVGIPTLEEIALMNLTVNAIPFENLYEFELLQKLTADHRRFVRALRYNRPSTKPLATALLVDTDPATALYVDAYGDPEYQMALEELIAESQLKTWCWNAGPGGGAMLALPPKAVGATATSATTNPKGVTTC